MTTPLPSPRRTMDPEESTSPGDLSASFDSPVSADWSTVNAPVRSFTSAGMMSPGRTRTMSPGTNSRAGTTCQLESRRTRALTCNRFRRVSDRKFHVRRDDVAGSHANDVAGDQLPGGNDLPAGIAPDARTDLQSFPQGFNDTGGPALLHKAQHGVDHQQRAHHNEIGEVLQQS